MSDEESSSGDDLEDLLPSLFGKQKMEDWPSPDTFMGSKKITKMAFEGVEIRRMPEEWNHTLVFRIYVRQSESDTPNATAWGKTKYIERVEEKDLILWAETPYDKFVVENEEKNVAGSLST